MKLFRYGPKGKEVPGITDDNDNHWDITAFGEDFDGNFLENDGLARLQKWLEENPGKVRKIDRVERFGPPVTGVSKIICVGLNFSDHALESKMELPKEPVLFFKATTAITGPNDDVTIPRNSVKTDWEVELALVIGKRASYVEENNAMDYVSGFMLHNDYSEREFQLERSGQWVKGKSCDTFAPIGPYLVTKDSVPDVHNLSMWLDVNGKRMQDGSSKDMIFQIPFLVSYISQFMTLLPGDIISTGTPAGVGLAQKPDPVYLREGDKVALGIEKLGSSMQTLVSWK